VVKSSRGKVLYRIRQLLQRRRRLILETSRAVRRELGALKGQERDPEYEENAQSELADYTLYHLMENQRLEIQLIDLALVKMDNGTFGQCIDCGADIAYERLRALPFATRCAEDAARRELEVAGRADFAPSL
jgi:DnaK suppressor protein